MAITTTDSRTKESVHTHVGRVVEIRHMSEMKNHSDTLDYTDLRQTEMTYALVYLGPTVNGKDSGYNNIRRVCLNGVPQKFGLVDLTNIFAWRGYTKTEGSIDYLLGVAVTEPTFFDDLEEFYANERAKAESDRLHEIAVRDAIAREREDAERNRPILGRHMEVFKGRRVPVGTSGVVAFVREDRVLLKSPDSWQNRSAQGTWVRACNLRAKNV